MLLKFFGEEIDRRDRLLLKHGQYNSFTDRRINRERLHTKWKTKN